MRADEKYPTMSYEKLAGMKDVINRICEENCVMLMWATATKLPEAVDLIKAWGFEYVTVWMNWHKTNSNSSPLFTKGCGAYSRICAEVLLLSAKGEKLKYKYVPSMFIVGNTVQIDEESFLLLGKRGRIYPFKNENKFTPSSILEDKSHQMEDLLIEDKDVLQSFDCSEKILKLEKNIDLLKKIQDCVDTNNIEKAFEIQNENLQEFECNFSSLFPGSTHLIKRQNVIRKPRPERHSEKPRSIYRMIEKTFTGATRRIELFARNSWDGWSCWGNDCIHC